MLSVHLQILALSQTLLPLPESLSLLFVMCELWYLGPYTVPHGTWVLSVLQNNTVYYLLLSE